MELWEIAAGVLLALSNWQDTGLYARSYLIRQSDLTRSEKALKLYDLFEIGMTERQVSIVLGENCRRFGWYHGFFTGRPHFYLLPYPINIAFDKDGRLYKKELLVRRDPSGNLRPVDSRANYDE